MNRLRSLSAGAAQWRALVIIVVALLAVGAWVAGRQRGDQSDAASASPADTPSQASASSDNVATPTVPAPSTAPTSATAAVPAPGAASRLPRLVDLGAGKCIPCKMMAPILEDLKSTHATQFEVQFIDVWENPDAGKPYDIRIIPTQIFYSPEGRELFRHEGFFSKDDILGKWRELGYQFKENQE